MIFICGIKNDINELIYKIKIDSDVRKKKNPYCYQRGKGREG